MQCLILLCFDFLLQFGTNNFQVHSNIKIQFALFLDNQLLNKSFSINFRFPEIQTFPTLCISSLHHHLIVVLNNVIYSAVCFENINSKICLRIAIANFFNFSDCFRNINSTIFSLPNASTIENIFKDSSEVKLLCNLRL